MRCIQQSGQVVHLVEHEDSCARELYADLPSLVADKENAQPISGASNGAQVERDDAASSTTEREFDGWGETGDDEGCDFGLAATDELAATNKPATELANSDAITPAPAPAPAPAAAKRQVPAGEKAAALSALRNEISAAQPHHPAPPPPPPSMGAEAMPIVSSPVAPVAVKRKRQPKQPKQPKQPRQTTNAKKPAAKKKPAAAAAAADRPRAKRTKVQPDGDELSDEQSDSDEPRSEGVRTPCAQLSPPHSVCALQ